MNLADIDVVVITYNEAANLERTLNGLRWAERVVVLDSGSTDATVAIAARFANVELLTRPFDTQAGQCQAGLDELRKPWALTLDADYVLSPEFVRALEALEPRDTDAVFARFRYWIHGQPLSASLLPPRPVLFPRTQAHYVDDGHAQRLVHGPRTQTLPTPLEHDDRKPLARWLSSQIRYAELEALKLTAADGDRSRLSARLRLIPGLAPIAAFGYAWLIRGTWRDGWRGFFYALQRGVAEGMILLALIERRLSSGSQP
jgi:glycosyltransferase involved in cell wall biosynthesis